MSLPGATLLLLAVVACLSHVTSGLFPPKANRTYEVLDVKTGCTAEEIRARIQLNRSFRGVVYAKGFPLEKNCRSFGTNNNHVDITISTSGCGVRLVPLDEETLSFTVSLNVQMDKFLQQINDIEMSVSCNLSPNDMVHTKHAILNKQASRTGRYQTAVPGGDDATLRSIRSWMEIEGTSGRGPASKVSVGEQTLVLVKSLLPEEMSANVVDCFAHDGTREVTQRLLDESGCPLDETIMPSLETIRYEDENEIGWESGEEEEATGVTTTPSVGDEGKQDRGDVNMKMQVIGTMFSAFKFPDTSNLHLKCVLQICKRICPVVTCDGGQNRTAKSAKSDFTTIVDRIEVFNSVEVVAPGIDNDGYTSPEDSDEARSAAGEKTFCLSASKMAFSFAILGAIFLCGVLAALWTIMRNQMRKLGKSSYDGSEQILVVRDSPLNLMHPRTKPYTNWSYT